VKTVVPRHYHADPWATPTSCSTPPHQEVLPRIVPSLLLGIDGTPESGPAIDLKLIAGSDVELTCIVDPQALHEAVARLTGSGLLAIDFEVAAHPDYRGFAAAALQPATAAPRLLSLYSGGTTAYVIDLWALGAEAIAPLRWLLRRHRTVAHHATYDLKMAWRIGLDLPDLHCSRIATAILDGERGTGLAAACERRLRVIADKTLQRFDYGIKELPASVLYYAAQDAILSYRLFNQCAEEITHRKLCTGYAIARGAIRQVAHAETRGLLVDHETLTAFGNASADKANQAKSEMPKGLAGVNCRSSKQLQGWFAGNADNATRSVWPKTPKGSFDFSKKGLGAAPSGEVRNALLKVAEARSGMQRGGMVASRAALINPATGCVHASFKLLGTDAGRLSSSGPNVQQLPPGERKAYVARPGHTFVDADAGGLQLRIAAAFGVESMAGAFLQGIDLHSLAGGGIDINDPERETKIAAVEEQSRKSGKAANFSLLFGMSIPTFHARLRGAVSEALTEEDAARVYHAWYKAWPEVAGMQDALFSEARRNGYSTTPGGRIRDYLRDGIPNWHQIRNITLNASIQGADADLIMLVAAYLDIALMHFEGASVAVLVHDEVLIECKVEHSEEVAKVLDTAWRWAWAKLFPHRLDLGSMSPAFCQPTIGRSFGDV
jgi:DNA polymerase-1